MIPLCDAAVTVYRKDGIGVTRQVVENCFYHYGDVQEDSLLGEQLIRPFLLVTAPGAYTPRPGDRVYGGIGPEEVVWEEFLPCTTEALGEIAYVTPWYLGGELHHYESGRK